MGGSWGKSLPWKGKKACKLGNMCKSQVTQAELRCLGLETLPFAGFQAWGRARHTRLMAGE